MLRFNRNTPDILFFGDKEMVVLNISNYKNTRNDEDAIMNLGEKKSIEVNMMNKYHDIIVGLEQCVFVSKQEI